MVSLARTGLGRSGRAVDQGGAMSTTLMEDFTPAERPDAPYPGLRPFEKHEWSIFFGRETMVQDVVSRLLARKLVAIHGESGCGKSSLVRAGVLPFLESDQARSGGSWRTVEFRPGDSPLANLSAALLPLSPATDDPLTIRRLLMRGETAPAKIAGHLGLTIADNLCILFDQFEELFEHARRRGPTEAEIITGFLVSLALNPPAGLHVIVTMRSDYLGQCAHWRGFAETVNETQYLVPRMERPALWRAIREPATLFGGTLSPELTERVIAEAGYGQDQLPLIQHGLMRLWQRKTGGDPDAEGWRLDLPDFRALDGGGGLAGILSDHADQCLQGQDEPVAEAIFRALSDRNADGEAIRRPQTLQQLADIAGTDTATVATVLAPFRAAGAAFIRPGGDTPLTPETRIDIGHESFLRAWRRIADPEIGWLKRETDDGLRWMSLRLQARDFTTSRRLLADGAEQDAAKLMGRTTEAWAGRHGGDWGAVKKLVETSQEAAAKRKRRGKRTLVGALAAAVVFALIAGLAGWQTRVAQMAKEKALEASRLAIVAGEEAKMARDAATLNESVSLAALAQVAASKGQYADAVKLALAAWPRKGDEGRIPLKRVLDVFAANLPLMKERLRFRQMDRISSINYSNDGEKIVTTSDDRTIQLWDAHFGNPLGKPILHDSKIKSAIFSPDNTRILICSNKDLKLWNITDEKQIGDTIINNNFLRTASFSQDGNRIFSVAIRGEFSVDKLFDGDNVIQVWDAFTAKPLGKPLNHKHPERSLIFSPDGSLFLTITNDNDVNVWSTSTVSQFGRTLNHVGKVHFAIISQDNNLVLSASENVVTAWDLHTGKRKFHLLHSYYIKEISISPEMDRIYTTTNDGNIYAWAYQDGKSILLANANSDKANNVAFSPNGRWVKFDFASEIRVFDLKDWSLVREIFIPELNFSSSFSADSEYIFIERLQDMRIVGLSIDVNEIMPKYTISDSNYSINPNKKLQIATTSIDGTASVFDISNKITTYYTLPDVKSHHKNEIGINASFSSKSVILLNENEVGILDTLSGSLTPESIEIDEMPIYSSISENGRFVSFLSSSGKVNYWSIESKKVLPFFNDDKKHALAFLSHDGSQIVTQSQNNILQIWNTASKEQIGKGIAHHKEITAIALSKDGKFIATAGMDNIVTVWKTETGESIGHEFRHPDRNLPIALKYKISSLSFSPNGQYISSTSLNGTARIWDLNSGKQIGSTIVHDRPIVDGIFSEDGHRFISASNDYVLWDVQSSAPIDILSSRTLPFEHSKFAYPSTAIQNSVSTVGGIRVLQIKTQMQGNAFEVACQRLGNNTDLSDVIAKYGLGKLTPICGENMPILPDMSTLQ
jgi:WD40 repeat protein